MSYRERDIVALDITTAYGDKVQVRTYIGMLPEDMLEVLMKQFISRRVRGISKWSGPDEKIQQLLTGTVSSAKREVS